MKRWIFLLSAYCLLLTTFNAEAASIVSAQELLENLEIYDGKTVIYRGEVIGDIMRQAGFAWLNVRDESGAIGVFCPQDLAGELKLTGSYKHKGEMISVQGVFHRFCPEHGGDTDIHAEKIVVVEKGAAITHPIEPEKVKMSITLAAIVFVLAVIHLIARRFR